MAPPPRSRHCPSARAAAVRNTPPEHLVRARDERIARHRESQGEEGADRPGDRGRDHDEEADGGRAGPEPRQDDQREPDEADGRSEAKGTRDAISGHSPHEDYLQRNRPRDHRRDARVDPRLGNVDDADAEGEEKQADERAREQLPRADPEAAASERENEHEDQAGREEARASGEQGRKRLDGDLDSEIRRAPDEVDDAERQPYLSRRRGHAKKNVDEAMSMRTRWSRPALREVYSDPRWSRARALMRPPVPTA